MAALLEIMLFGVVIFFACLFSWRTWGERLSTFLENTILRDKSYDEDYEAKDSLEYKIKSLKKKSARLKLSNDELKIGKMLEEIEKQVKEKEDELAEVNKRLGIE